MVNDGKLILVPGKVVFTVKPPPPADGDLPVPRAPRWKRKARIVICGNMAGQMHKTQDWSVSGSATVGFVLGVCL